MPLFKAQFVAIAIVAATLIPCFNADAGKTSTNIRELQKQVERQKDEIDLLKMRLELLETLVKPDQENHLVRSDSQGIIGPFEITYP